MSSPTSEFGLNSRTVFSRQFVAGAITDHSRVAVEFKQGELGFETPTAKK